MAIATLPIRFAPSRAEGWRNVSEIVLHPDRLEVCTEGRWVTVRFAEIGQRQESRLASAMKRLVCQRPFPQLVAARHFHVSPAGRYIEFHTHPQLKVYMPADEVTDYLESYFLRFQQIIRSGGYETADLN